MEIVNETNSGGLASSSSSSTMGAQLWNSLSSVTASNSTTSAVAGSGINASGDGGSVEYDTLDIVTFLSDIGDKW